MKYFVLCIFLVMFTFSPNFANDPPPTNPPTDEPLPGEDEPDDGGTLQELIEQILLDEEQWFYHGIADDPTFLDGIGSEDPYVHVILSTDVFNQVVTATIFSPNGSNLGQEIIDEEWGDFFEDSSGFGF